MNSCVKLGYKLTEVGVIPEDWSVTPLHELTTEIGDGIHTTPIYSRNGKYSFVNGNNLQDGKVIISEGTKSVDYAEFKKHCKNLGDNSILMSINGTIGNLGLFAGEPIILGKSAAYLNLKNDISKLFVYYALQSDCVKTQFSDGLTGTTIKNLGLGTIRETGIPLPVKLIEQRAIADALSDMDALVSGLDQLIAKKRDIKQVITQQLLTGQQRLPGFSGEWKVKTFEEIFDFLSTATNARSDLTESGDTYYIHYGDIHTRFHNHLNLSCDQPPKIERALCKNAELIRNGDWVMADASENFAGVGKTIEVSGLHDDDYMVAGLHTFLLREKTPTFAAGFKGHLGNLESIHQQYLRVATGMKVYGVSKAALKNLVLPVPKLEEQTAITTILSDLDTDLAILKARCDKARQIKLGMMQELLTGSIRLI